MLIIAGRINASRKYIAQAISSRNAAFIQDEAKAQDQAGADFIDVSAGTFANQEAQMLQWVIEAVQKVTEKPLSIDSPNPAVIAAMLPLVKKTPMINSITLETRRLEGIVPLVAAHKTKVIALCQTEETCAETTDDKLKIAEKLVTKITAAGIPLADVYIDPLVHPLAANERAAVDALRSIRRILAEFPGVHTTCGLANVSHGLPCRKLINRSFLVAAVTCGLDSAIMDPTDTPLFAALKAAIAINGGDAFCVQLMAAYREGRLGP